MYERPPTINDVARQAGVSRATASRVINNIPGASDVVRARVHGVVTELGYRPNAAARALASGRTDTVELIVAGHQEQTSWFGADPYYSRIVAGMISALAGTDARLRIHVLGADDDELIDRVARTTTFGAVVANIPARLAARVHARCPRTVSIGETAPAVPAVVADNTGGAVAAVAHLHAMGRRRIGAIHGPAGNPCAQSRRDGYGQAVRDLGQPDRSAAGDFDRDSGFHAAARLLAEVPDIDGLFVASDLMAAGAVQAVAATGRRVPGDISIVGFDDSVVAACTTPPLTTMRLPVEDMAAAATRSLLDGGAATAWRLMFPVELIVRQSAAPTAT
jgi:DNA-binding LacI/PurR family transcriptional regulator